jgi:FXSXX-COOH protein
MTEDASPGGTELFCSDIIDLSSIDLSAVSELPDTVLRSAISRVLRELASNGGASSSFQSSLAGRHPADEEPLIESYGINRNIA